MGWIKPVLIPIFETQGPAKLGITFTSFSNCAFPGLQEKTQCCSLAILSSSYETPPAWCLTARPKPFVALLPTRAGRPMMSSVLPMSTDHRQCLSTALPPSLLCCCSTGWPCLLFTGKHKQGRGYCYNWNIRNWFLSHHFIVPDPDSVPEACHSSAGMAVWQKQSLIVCCGSQGPSGTHLILNCLKSFFQQ